VGVANRRRVEASFWGACWAAALGYLGGRHMLIDPMGELGDASPRTLPQTQKKRGRVTSPVDIPAFRVSFGAIRAPATSRDLMPASQQRS
jgi:hypothetical protein